MKGEPKEEPFVLEFEVESSIVDELSCRLLLREGNGDLPIPEIASYCEKEMAICPSRRTSFSWYRNSIENSKQRASKFNLYSTIKRTQTKDAKPLPLPLSRTEGVAADWNYEPSIHSGNAPLSLLWFDCPVFDGRCRTPKSRNFVFVAYFTYQVLSTWNSKRY